MTTALPVPTLNVGPAGLTSKGRLADIAERFGTPTSIRAPPSPPPTRPQGAGPRPAQGAGGAPVKANSSLGILSVFAGLAPASTSSPGRTGAGAGGRRRRRQR